MSKLPRRSELQGTPASPWCCGAARCSTGTISGGAPLVLGVRCRLGESLEVEALLDTGAEWSLIGGELAEVLAEECPREHDDEKPLLMSTRVGSVRGVFHRVPVTLIADTGASLEVSASVLLAKDWRLWPVLGYRGFLERIRIALDPGDVDEPARCFFGSSG